MARLITGTLGRRPLKFLENRHVLTLLLAGVFLWSLSVVEWRGSLVHSGGGAAASDFLRGLFPPEVSTEFLRLCLVASWQTVSFAVAGITVAVAIGFPLGVVASGTGFSRGTLRAAAAVRLLLAGMRSIHELVWAVLFVTAFGLSPLAAILAIALSYGGILGRIYADLINDVPDPPLQALRASGASPMRVLLYGRLPMALPELLSYTFYRFECAIRAAAIMSFVGIRGLGYEIQLSLNDLLFSQVWTLMLFMIALVMLVDMWSSRLRRSLVS